MIRLFTTFVASALLMFGGAASNAQDFTSQNDRAAYAGAYLSMSFGGGKVSYKRPIRYGFSAGFRKRTVGQSSSYYGGQFGHRDANLNMLDDKDWQARVVDLNFSDRGFEHFSLSGSMLVEKDALGRLVYNGGRYSLESDEEESGVSLGRALLWTGAVVGVVGIAFFITLASDDECCF